MKKTNIKRIAAFTASILAVAALAVPMTALADDTTPTTYSITINNDATGHTYEAYQIFTGDLSGSTLSNIAWGTNVNTAATDFYTKLAAVTGKESTTPFSAITSNSTASDIATILSNNNSDATLAKNFADFIGGYITGTAAASQSTQTADADGDNVKEYLLTGLTAGYYLVKDSNGTLANDYDAYTSYILKVVADTSAAPKSAIPKVDKQVHDEPADAETNATDGWGETADHALNESYQYKLIATIPADSDLADYSSYKLVFNDTMGKGVTYDKISSVTVGTTSLTDSDYSVVTATDAATGVTTLTITVNNVMAHDTNLTDVDTVVTVIYDAHLDADATRLNASATDEKENINTVYLQYSNNPNWDGTGTEELGQTTPDSVWVFTYDINVSKTDGDSKALNGAGFRLYSDKDCTTEVSVVWDDTLGAYRLATGNEVGVEMTSGKGDAEGTTSGKFTIAGLDTGTYYLKETTTPAGYNTCANTEVIIGATHSENADAASATVTLTNANSMSPTIVNQAGSSLPSTGGIGTTLFYVGGGALALGAGVLLVSKKRMANK